MDDMQTVPEQYVWTNAPGSEDIGIGEHYFVAGYDDVMKTFFVYEYEVVIDDLMAHVDDPCISEHGTTPLEIPTLVKFKELVESLGFGLPQEIADLLEEDFNNNR